MESVTSGDGGAAASFDTKRKDVLGKNHKIYFRTTVNSRSKAPGNLFKDVWQLKGVKPCKKASYS